MPRNTPGHWRSANHALQSPCAQTPQLKKRSHHYHRVTDLITWGRNGCYYTVRRRGMCGTQASCLCSFSYSLVQLWAEQVLQTSLRRKWLPGTQTPQYWCMSDITRQAIRPAETTCESKGNLGWCVGKGMDKYQGPVTILRVGNAVHTTVSSFQSPPQINLLA
jgi:hypothetical protein